MKRARSTCWMIKCGNGFLFTHTAAYRMKDAWAAAAQNSTNRLEMITMMKRRGDRAVRVKCKELK